jgi:hypothetical protein
MNARIGGYVTVEEVDEAALRLAMVAMQMEQIDLAILRTDREIARQQARRTALLQERAKLERIAYNPLQTTA